MPFAIGYITKEFMHHCLSFHSIFLSVSVSFLSLAVFKAKSAVELCKIACFFATLSIQAFLVSLNGFLCRLSLSFDKSVCLTQLLVSPKQMQTR